MTESWSLLVWMCFWDFTDLFRILDNFPEVLKEATSVRVPTDLPTWSLAQDKFFLLLGIQKHNESIRGSYPVSIQLRYLIVGSSQK